MNSSIKKLWLGLCTKIMKLLAWILLIIAIIYFLYTHDITIIVEDK